MFHVRLFVAVSLFHITRMHRKKEKACHSNDLVYIVCKTISHVVVQPVRPILFNAFQMLLTLLCRIRHSCFNRLVSVLRFSRIINISNVHMCRVTAKCDALRLICGILCFFLTCVNGNVYLTWLVQTALVWTCVRR